MLGYAAMSAHGPSLSARLAQRPSYKWWVFAASAATTFLVVIDLNTINPALPRIANHFDASLVTMQWVVTCYALMLSVLILPMGRLGDIANRKRVYVAGFGIFVVSAFVSAFSTSTEMLIGAKLAQGVGAAMVQSNTTAMMMAVFPAQERGTALGMNHSVVGVAAIAAPAVGGIMVDAFDWRSIFFLTAGVGVAAMAIAHVVIDPVRFAPEREGGQAQRFDWAGGALSTTGLLAFLLVLGRGFEAGWTSPPIVAGAVGCAALLAAFVWQERRSPHPLLDLSLFRRRLVLVSLGASGAAYVSIASVMFLMPFYIQEVLGHSARATGFALIPGAVCTTFIGPAAGRLSDRFGWRVFTVAGLGVNAVSIFLMALLLRSDSSLGIVVPLLMLMFAGHAMFQSPNLSSMMSAVEPARYGVASALMHVMRNGVNIVGIAVTTAVVASALRSQGYSTNISDVSGGSGGAFVTGMRQTLLGMSAVLAAGAAFSLLRTGKPRT